MHHEQIKAHIRMGGTTPAQIARELGVSPSTVYVVMQGKGKSLRIAKRICEVTNKLAAEVWPGSYPHLEAEQAKKPRAQAKKVSL